MKENRTVVPKDFLTAVKDIKLAILQARARAAQMSNVEALKLYFFVGGYISKKTRKAKWGSGAINALSDRLQVELPGLRGFSPQHIRFMRQFYEEWSPVLGCCVAMSPEFKGFAIASRFCCNFSQAGIDRNWWLVVELVRLGGRMHNPFKFGGEVSRC